jgi:hypothetical protein
LVRAAHRQFQMRISRNLRLDTSFESVNEE